MAFLRLIDLTETRSELSSEDGWMDGGEPYTDEEVLWADLEVALAQSEVAARLAWLIDR